MHKQELNESHIRETNKECFALECFNDGNLKTLWTQFERQTERNTSQKQQHLMWAKSGLYIFHLGINKSFEMSKDV